MRERRLGDVRSAPATSGRGDWIVDRRLGVQIVASGGAHRRRADRLRFIAPDDGNADDRTVLAVPLDTPVAPGGTRRGRRSPGRRTCRAPFARTGVIGNYYFIAQWFPKIGVLEDGGWNCHQFHTAPSSSPTSASTTSG